MTGDGDRYYVWQVLDDDGTWGLIVALLPKMSDMVPLLSRRLDVADLMRPTAVAHGRAAQRPVRLVAFDLGHVMERIELDEMSR